MTSTPPSAPSRDLEPIMTPADLAHLGIEARSWHEAHRQRPFIHQGATGRGQVELVAHTSTGEGVVPHGRESWRHGHNSFVATSAELVGGNLGGADDVARGRESDDEGASA